MGELRISGRGNGTRVLIRVNPAMSEKKMVTSSWCSGSICHSKQPIVRQPFLHSDRTRLDGAGDSGRARTSTWFVQKASSLSRCGGLHLATGYEGLGNVRREHAMHHQARVAVFLLNQVSSDAPGRPTSAGALPASGLQVKELWVQSCTCSPRVRSASAAWLRLG